MEECLINWHRLVCCWSWSFTTPPKHLCCCWWLALIWLFSSTFPSRSAESVTTGACQYKLYTFEFLLSSLLASLSLSFCNYSHVFAHLHSLKMQSLILEVGARLVLPVGLQMSAALVFLPLCLCLICPSCYFILSLLLLLSSSPCLAFSLYPGSFCLISSVITFPHPSLISIRLRSCISNLSIIPPLLLLSFSEHFIITPLCCLLLSWQVPFFTLPPGLHYILCVCVCAHYTCPLFCTHSHRCTLAALDNIILCPLGECRFG